MTEELPTLELTEAEVSLAQEWYQKLQYCKQYRTLSQDESLYKRMRKFLDD